MKINYLLLASLIAVSNPLTACPDAAHAAQAVTPSNQTYAIGKLAIKGCWARPGQQERNTAVYMTIKNNDNTTEDRLVKAECQVCNTVELHDHINENGVMKMRPVNGINIKDTAELKPGSLHIMLMGLKQDLKEGDQVEMKLTFEKAGEITVTLPVQKPKV